MTNFLSLHPCRGGDWRNRPSRCIRDFVASDAREGICRGIVLTLCKATVEIRCTHVLESYPQNYYAQKDELIYLKKGTKTYTYYVGFRLNLSLFMFHFISLLLFNLTDLSCSLFHNTHCRVLLNDGSNIWRKTLKEDVVEQLLYKSLFDVPSVDNAFIADNIRTSRFEALDHTDTLLSHLEGMEALFRIEYDSPGEPIDSEFLIVSGQELRFALHISLSYSM